MKILLVLLGLVALTSAQFSQGRFIRFDDDDFDDFFDLDDDLDSLEDLYEDLYDDDADDRAEARAKLTRLRASGAITGSAFRNSRFLPASRRNTGFRQSGFRSSSGFGGSGRFNAPTPSNRFVTQPPRSSPPRPATFNTPRPSPFNIQRPSSTFSNQRPSSTFSNQRPSSTFTNQRPSTFNNAGFRSGFSQTSNRFNNAFARPTAAPRRTFGSSSSNKFSSSNTALNTINTGSSVKTTSPFKTFPAGINWPGGNGYYFSMSTNGAKPVSYFISYDD